MRGEGGSKISQNMLIYSTKTAYERGEGGVKNLQKYAYVICESPLRNMHRGLKIAQCLKINYL